jgi:hypothetical protein
MFRRFTLDDPARAAALFRLHPAALAALDELAFKFRVNDLGQPLGHPDHRSDLDALPDEYLNLFEAVRLNNPPPLQEFDPGPPLRGITRSNHLIYAYMIECTRIYEIFRRVLDEFLFDEQLGVPDSDVQFWLRNTEQLFYRDPGPFYIESTTSKIREDEIEVRRNAYQRVFGMDLIHGKGTEQTYPYRKAKTANTEFVAIFEEFLREVWVGIANVENESGENPTDDAAISDLATKLFDMLSARRLGGNLAQEEYRAVKIMDWLRLTLAADFPIIKALRAEAPSAEQRLHKIAARVGLPAPTRTKSFLDLADPMSRLLILIEFGTFSNVNAVPALYNPGDLQADIRLILTHWSLATGHDLKIRRPAPVGLRA